ncbi:MAG: hypothetical protein EZS28_028552 [Streblomastix strix]|uniref:Uncharacterized protein n=1 Tax=Streblomastix strix TaxID=222440 RepID=A0A5J4V0N9_9EUKA|nr:MAG: hypothetical protein EZS28_028552 [Streblomastix strix]
MRLSGMTEDKKKNGKKKKKKMMMMMKKKKKKKKKKITVNYHEAGEIEYANSQSYPCEPLSVQLNTAYVTVSVASIHSEV